MSYKYLSVCLAVIILALLSRCTPDSVSTDPSDRLTFSDDTLHFDTVFVTMGSTTEYFLAFNENDRDLNVDRIWLAGGENSAFRINVDGSAVTEAEDVSVWTDDSLYVFVEVTIDPNADQLPFVVEDSVFFETNGNIQQVKLAAWGQNAHFFGPGTSNGYIIGSTQDTTWTNDLPYVVYGGVIVDSLKTLTIEPGVDIYMHNGAQFVVTGTLEVMGGTDTTERVTFQGTRLEEWYEESPGQWFGFYFDRGSRDNIIKGADIKNSTYGIWAGWVNFNGLPPTLAIENTRISHSAVTGLRGVDAGITATNLQLLDCGSDNNVQLLAGGSYVFNHCTFTNFDGFYHKASIVATANSIADYTAADPSMAPPLYNPNLKAHFYNCVIVGSEEEELNIYDLAQAEGYEFLENESFDVQFTNCCIRTKDSSLDYFESGNHFNPLFNNTFVAAYGDRDYRPIEGSVLVDNALPNSQIEDPQFISTNTDILGLSRDANPDIGCYEYFPE